ncbi:pilus assembly protein TadG-related protein [Acidimicrobiia bacterium EGI L10123]|uniref:pilus assembly protein TadG-related protein n=1 Tax=Salinilacustrithrix flava TaxID=2957203 RepID=UPI003D7C22DA|nr:pilus assembly protein TadG-related protein [Acidimicrobiia bacterium EGI L10123]
MSSRVRRGERGAFLLIFALSLTVILIIVAMTVDLGQARSSKRDEQQLADLASLSAGREMAGYGATSGGTVVSRPQDACKAAMASIRTNATGFNPTNAQIDAACSTFPMTIAGCTATTPLPSNATVIDDPYAVTVRWPIPPEEIEDPRFSGDGLNDGTDQCQRMRIAVQRVDDTAFAGVIGVGSLTTSANAVIRSTLDNDNKIIPAFLILERSDCDALGTSANGADVGGIQILGIPSTDQPGTIHVDTTANSGCNGNAANSVAVYGKPLSSGGPSIHLHPSPSTGVEGLLYVVATSNAAKEVPGGVNATPQPGDVVSRVPVDEEFNSTANPAVTDLHSRARAAASITVSSDTVGDGWKRLDCDLNAFDDADTDAANWYIRCDTYDDTTGRIDDVASVLGTPNRIVFDGDVKVPNGQSLSFTTAAIGDVAEVTIRGKLSVAGGIDFGTRVERIYVGGIDGYDNSMKNSSSFTVANTGSVRIRSNSLPTLAVGGSVNTVCPTGAQSGWAELAIFGDDGPNLDSAGNMAMCNTMVYTAGDTLSSGYQVQQTINGGNCSTDEPCPKKTGNIADAGRLEFNGVVDWTAPNTTSGVPPSPRGLEDLLFWSEGSGTTDLKAGAKVVTQGIFFGPSMNVEFRSPAVSSPRNAQFIARRLRQNQGTLYMLPNPNDSTPIPAPGSFSIIR